MRLEKWTSTLFSACLNPSTVHFSIAGIFGWAMEYEDDEEDGGCFTGGGEGWSRRLGVWRVEQMGW